MCGDLCEDVYGDMWERMPGRQKHCQACSKMLVYLAGLNGCLLGKTLSRGYIKCSSSARLTAARRLLTLSLL
jgi:hypothetical protein